MRQLTAALTLPGFDGFKRVRARPVDVVTLTEYESALPVSVAFPPEHVKPCLAEALADAGRAQLKVAETEKYAHVTYFFNGGEEEPFEGEDRTLVPSPKVATYDLQPEMSARGGRGRRARRYESRAVRLHPGELRQPRHGGSYGPDPRGLGRGGGGGCLPRRSARRDPQSPEWVALVTADHGNCEMMIDGEGNVHTAHTTEPVDFVVVDPRSPHRRIGGPGKLADVAPTVLDLMGIAAPAEMTGVSLLAERGGRP